MNRRRFLKLFSGVVGGVALAEAVPFGRVYSFPRQIKPLNVAPLTTIYYDQQAVENLKYNLVFGGRTTPMIMAARGTDFAMFKHMAQNLEAAHPGLKVNLVTPHQESDARPNHWLVDIGSM